MKKIIYLLLIILSFIFGYYIGDIDFNSYETKVEDYDYDIQVCNNTQIDFEFVNLFAGATYENIKSGRCSEYVKRKEMYGYIPMKISTLEDKKNYDYIITVIDYVGEKQLEEGKYTVNVNHLDKKSIPITQYFNSIEYNIIGNNDIKNNDLGYIYSKGNLIINYSKFLEKMNIDLVNSLIERIKNDKNILELSINIKNINGNNFDLINKIISSNDFEYYDYIFDNYSDDDNFIFNSLMNKEKVTELNLRFNDSLSGKNTLIKTLENIKRLNNKSWSYFWITGEENFMNSYKMTSEEVNLIHSMDLFGVYLIVYIEDSIDLDKKIEDFILSPKFAEYTLFKKFRKGAGLSGIYKTLDSGEEIKISEGNERL